MELSVTLAPDGGIRVILPSRRTLDLGCDSAAMTFLQRILRDGTDRRREQRGYVGEFPTQHVIDIWKKEAKRQQVEQIKEDFLEKGIDVNKLDFQL